MAKVRSKKLLKRNLLRNRKRLHRGTLLIAGIVLFAVAITTGYALKNSVKGSSNKPNIIFILFDDATKTDVEMMPNIKSLIADMGATFDRFYVTEPICCPNRTSFLTGEYVHNHQVVDNSGKNGGYGQFRRLGHEERTVAKELKSTGYKTALTGKYLNLYGPETNSSNHEPPYWDRWFAQLNNHQYYDYDVNDDGKIKHFGSKKSDYGDTTKVAAARTWINSMLDADEAFMAYIPVHAPHSPYTEPPGHHSEFGGTDVYSRTKPSYNEADVSDKPKHIRSKTKLSGDEKKAIDSRYRQRLRMMLETDDFIGNIVQDLEAKGELDNTYIFVSSDNGWMQGEHRLPAHKIYPYEESAHMPLLVRGPGIGKGIHISGLASMIDLFPTFTQLAGGSTTSRDGRSLLPLLLGNNTEWRNQLLIENMSDDDMLPRYFGLVNNQYKYVEYQTGEKELYDLINDPFETQSLHAMSPKSLLDTLKAKLEALKACRGDSCRIADSQ